MYSQLIKSTLGFTSNVAIILASSQRQSKHLCSERKRSCGDGFNNFSFRACPRQQLLFEKEEFERGKNRLRLDLLMWVNCSQSQPMVNQLLFHQLHWTIWVICSFSNGGLSFNHCLTSCSWTNLLCHSCCLVLEFIMTIMPLLSYLQMWEDDKPQGVKNYPSNSSVVFALLCL